MPGKGEIKEQIRTKINVETSASIVPICLFRQIFSITIMAHYWLYLILMDMCLSFSVKETILLKFLLLERMSYSIKR